MPLPRHRRVPDRRYRSVRQCPWHPRLNQLSFEALEARYLLSGQPAIAVDDVYRVAKDTTLRPLGSQTFVLTDEQFQWSIEDGGNGHVYERVLSSGDWEEANVKAGQHFLGDTQGHLATITSPAEQSFIASVFPDEITWIGAFQDVTAPDYSEPDGGWRWVTGEPWGYTNWTDGEPNDRGPEEFAEMSHSYRWNDMPDGWGRPAYLVELSRRAIGRG